MLKRQQIKAIDTFKTIATNQKKEELNTIKSLLWASNFKMEDYKELKNLIKECASVSLHFHPDRITEEGINVGESLLKTGMYKSQFETFISNGSVSAFKGGERDLWEKKLFDGSYHEGTIDMSDRPKYGALNLMCHPEGPAPRFGSCYLILKPEVSHRCTFTYQDSYTLPKERGTIEEFDVIMAALMKDLYFNEYALGEKEMRLSELFEQLPEMMKKSIQNRLQNPFSHNLNHYIEAQIHGDIELERDVLMLVADYSFKETPIGITLDKICQKYDIELLWHKGFCIEIPKIPNDFKGPNMSSLAKRIASNDTLTTYDIGRGAIDVLRNADDWKDRGSVAEILQEIKYLWHILVRFGKPLKG